MKKAKINIAVWVVLLQLFLALPACNKDTNFAPTEPKITVEVTPAGTRALVSVGAEYPGKFDMSVEWSRNADMDSVQSCPMEGEASSYQATLTGLSKLSTYYYRVTLSNSLFSRSTAVESFTTLDDDKPSVTTKEVTNIAFTTATCGGDVTNDGCLTVTERGICWSTSHNPTISGSHQSSGSGTGNFTTNIIGLTANTTYYVRAYATNSAGTAYGTEVTFTTLTGAIDGKFTINDSGGKVYFSQGNLQYQASTNTWRFAENQYDYIGSDNSNISQTYSGWIDLFGWGTSGWNCGNTYYRPWDSNNSCAEWYGPPGENNLIGSYANSDWGYYNAISNGGNTTQQWRTLTQSEWDFVFNTRNTSSGIRYVKAQVNGVNGVILFPDDWSTSYYSLNSTNNGNASFSSNVINAASWTNSLQSHGAVFLPAAGYRYGTSVGNVGSDGYYWSASYSNSDYAYLVNFYGSGLGADYNGNRGGGRSVRLACPAEN